MVGSFLVHLAAIVFFTVLPALRPPKELADDFFIVDVVAPGNLTGPTVAAVPPPSQPTPPVPEPEPTPEVEPEGARIEERQIVKTKKPPKEPEPDPPPRPTPSPPTPAPETGTTNNGGDPDRGLVLEEGSAGIGGGLQTGGSELSWYNTAVASALYDNWRQPGVAVTETLQVAVRFEILRDGTVSGLQIAESSGLSVLDRSVLRAVANASPLPPIPRTWTESTITARYLFELNSEE